MRARALSRFRSLFLSCLLSLSHTHTRTHTLYIKSVGVSAKKVSLHPLPAPPLPTLLSLLALSLTVLSLSLVQLRIKITVILVNPFLDRNVGAVARAMLNFGLHDLVLVDPLCDHLSQVSVHPLLARESLWLVWPPFFLSLPQRLMDGAQQLRG